MPLDPDVFDESAAYDGTGLTEELVIPIAQVQDMHLTRKTNGATYVILFEVPLQYLQDVAIAGDGHTVLFQGKQIGTGADIRRIGLTKDADNNRHVKLAFQFAQSEVKGSIARIGAAIVGDSEGELRIIPQYQQETLDLTSRAE
jgi:hypothetical protein